MTSIEQKVCDYLDEHWDDGISMQNAVKAVEMGQQIKIDKACNWLEHNIEKYIVAKADGAYVKNSIFDDFRKFVEMSECEI